MPYKNTEQLYFIRTSISHYYEAGSGAYAVPKLYQEGQAKRIVKQKNKPPPHPNDGYSEMVPVTISEGKGIILK